MLEKEREMKGKKEILELGYYELDLDKIKKRIEKENYPRKILLQVPEGIRMYVNKIIDAINKVYIEHSKEKPLTLIWLDSAFGSCDLPMQEAKQLGIDLIIHIGHEVFIK